MTSLKLISVDDFIEEDGDDHAAECCRVVLSTMNIKFLSLV